MSGYTRIIFSPRRDNGERVVMQLSADDAAKVIGKRGADWEATVTDQITGRTYFVIGAECRMAGCYCDALIVREEEKNG